MTGKAPLYLLAVFIITLSSCKQNYDCCYFDSAGVKIEEGDWSCGEVKLKEEEASDLEARMIEAAKEWNGSATCEASEKIESK